MKNRLIKIIVKCYVMRVEKQKKKIFILKTEVLKSWTCELSENSSARNLWEPSPSTKASITVSTTQLGALSHIGALTTQLAFLPLPLSAGLQLARSLSLSLSLSIYIYICSLHRPAKQIAAFIGMRFQKGWLGYLNCSIVTISYF